MVVMVFSRAFCRLLLENIGDTGAERKADASGRTMVTCARQASCCQPTTQDRSCVSIADKASNLPYSARNAPRQ